METHTCRSLHIHVSLCTRCPSSPYSLWRARQETQARRVLIQLLMMFLVVQHLSWPPSAPQGMGFLKSPCPKFSASLKHSHPKEAGKKTPQHPALSNCPPALKSKGTEQPDPLIPSHSHLFRGKVMACPSALLCDTSFSEGSTTTGQRRGTFLVGPR